MMDCHGIARVFMKMMYIEGDVQCLQLMSFCSDPLQLHGNGRCGKVLEGI